MIAQPQRLHRVAHRVDREERERELEGFGQRARGRGVALVEHGRHGHQDDVVREGVGHELRGMHGRSHGDPVPEEERRIRPHPGLHGEP